MVTTLQVNRQVETIDIRDADGTPLYEWHVATDDASLSRTLTLVGNAFGRARDLAAVDTEDPEELARARDETVRLQRAVISAIIGADGYRDVLTYIGDGEECDPAANVANVGEVFAALCTWLFSRCTSPQLHRTAALLQGMASGAA